MATLRFELSDSLQPLSHADWRRLFPGHPDSPELIELVQRSGLDGITFHCIVGRDEDKAVVVLPVFLADYSISSTLDEPAKTIIEKLEKVIPKLVRPRVLGVGFVEGEWGQIGIDPDLTGAQRVAAVEDAVRFLYVCARHKKAQLIAFKDFCPALQDILPEAVKSNFARATSLPFCQLALPYSSLDAYLNDLPRKVRHDLKRKLRQGAGVEVRYTTDVSAYLDQIYAMYCELVERTDLSFGVHNRLYFAEICRRVEGAFYLLFFVNDELIGFNLVIHQGDLLIDKYIGMKSQVGRANNLYFLAWMEKIRYCTANGVTRIHLGAAAEDVKVRLGARPIHSDIWFHHMNPLLHAGMSKLSPLLSYEPKLPDDSGCEEDAERPVAVGSNAP